MNFIRRLLKAKLESTKDQIRDWNDPDREENPMPCPEITIEDFDKVLYHKLLSEALTVGAIFSGTSVTLDGLHFDWNYDAEALVLHITCLKKPFFLGCEQIENQIRQLAAKAKGAV
jgi:hypothetical protein